jgi:hypothetical protein
MTFKKTLGVAALLVVVAAIYFYLYRDYFTHRDLPIHVTIRPRIGMRARIQPGANDQPPPKLVTFNLGGGLYKLTFIAVYSMSELATNKDASPIWHMVSDSNSIPVENFVYGWNIRGMHPEIKGSHAEPLQPDTGYRVVVKAGSRRGVHEFKTPPDDSQPAQ